MRLIAAILLLSAGPARADFFSDFGARAAQGALKPFALDLGGLLGGLSFSNGRALGMPGFEAGVVGVVQSPADKNDHIVRDAGIKAFGLPVLHAAVGLPYKIDIAAHGLEWDHMSLVGGGLRWQVYKPGLATKFLPHVGVAFWGDKVSHAAFKAAHFGFNAAASWNTPIVAPFVGAGFDVTRLSVGTAADTTLSGLSVNATGSRFDGGLDWKLIPFTRITTAAMLLHGTPAGRFSFELQF